MQEYVTFKGLVLRYLCYCESIFVSLFLIELDVTFCRFCSSTFAAATTLKNFNPTKDIRSVLSNLDKRIVVKIKLYIIYLKCRLVSDRNISCVVAVPTVKKNGKMFMRNIFCEGMYFWKLCIGFQFGYTAIFSLETHHSMQLLW